MKKYSSKKANKNKVSYRTPSRFRTNKAIYGKKGRIKKQKIAAGFISQRLKCEYCIAQT